MTDPRTPADGPAAMADPPFPEDLLPQRRASRAVVVLMALAQGGTFLALLAPVTVSLILKIQTIAPKDQVTAAISMVLSVAAFVALVVNPVVGRLSDRTTSRWGRRRPWMVAGCAVFIIGMLTVALAGSVPVVLVGWMLGQLGGNMILAPLLTTIADQVPEFQRGSVSGNVGVAQNVGILAAAYVASLFVQNMLLLFLVPAIVATITVIAFCVVLPDRQVQVHPDPVGWKGQWRTFWVNPRKHPDFGWAWASRFMMILTSFFFISFRLLYVQDRLGLSAQAATDVIALSVLIYTIALVIVAKIGGWLSDRLERRKVFVIVAAILFAVGTYLLVHVDSVSAFYLVEAVMGAGYGLYYAVDMALVVDVLPNPDDAAKDLGVMNIANALPQSLAPAVGGFLLYIGSAAGQNYTALFVIAALTGLLGALTILPIKKVR